MRDQLKVKKKFRDHLIIASHFNEKPNYVKLAKTLGKRHKSVFHNKKIIDRFEKEQLFGRTGEFKVRKISPKINKNMKLQSLNEEISELRL